MNPGTLNNGQQPQGKMLFSSDICLTGRFNFFNCGDSLHELNIVAR